MKKCFRCGIEKPLIDFYQHPMMADGRLGKCKECARADVLANRTAHLERYREYDRERAKLPHRRQNAMRVAKAWHKKHPGRDAAQTKAQRHHRKAPDACQMCGQRKNRLERHHPDYALPLLIVWLCKPCHAIADRVRREKETTK